MDLSTPTNESCIASSCILSCSMSRRRSMTTLLIADGTNPLLHISWCERCDRLSTASQQILGVLTLCHTTPYCLTTLPLRPTHLRSVIRKLEYAFSVIALYHSVCVYVCVCVCLCVEGEGGGGRGLESNIFPRSLTCAGMHSSCPCRYCRKTGKGPLKAVGATLLVAFFALRVVMPVRHVLVFSLALSPSLPPSPFGYACSFTLRKHFRRRAHLHQRHAHHL